MSLDKRLQDFDIHENDSDVESRLTAARRQGRRSRNVYRSLVAAATIVALAATGIAVPRLLNEKEQRGVASTPSPSVSSAPSLPQSWHSIGEAPIGGRVFHEAVWTGHEMLVWGGFDRGNGEFHNTGARFDPGTGRWREIPAAPIRERGDAAAVWTGSEMIVWGGTGGEEVEFDDGAAFNPKADTWRLLPRSPLGARSGPLVAWTGKEMILWGGGRGFQPPWTDGAAYDPERDSWRVLRPSPLPGSGLVSAWTGSEFLIWSTITWKGVGKPARLDNAGAAYDPRTDQWRTIPRAPLSNRSGTYSVWTGKELIVWGGRGISSDPYKEPGVLEDGAAYTPTADRWRMLSKAPIPMRLGAGITWTGERMVLWGGEAPTRRRPEYDDGVAYDPSEDRWYAIPPAPLQSRLSPSAIWTGEEVILWGGWHLGGFAFADGAAFKPGNEAEAVATAAPSPCPENDAPLNRRFEDSSDGFKVEAIYQPAHPCADETVILVITTEDSKGGRFSYDIDWGDGHRSRVGESAGCAPDSTPPPTPRQSNGGWELRHSYDRPGTYSLVFKTFSSCRAGEDAAIDLPIPVTVDAGA